MGEITYDSADLTNNGRHDVDIYSVAAAERIVEPLRKVPFLEGMELDDWGGTPITGTSFQRITFNFKRLER